MYSSCLIPTLPAGCVCFLWPSLSPSALAGSTVKPSSSTSIFRTSKSKSFLHYDVHFHELFTVKGSRNVGFSIWYETMKIDWVRSMLNRKIYNMGAQNRKKRCSRQLPFPLRLRGVTFVPVSHMKPQ